MERKQGDEIWTLKPKDYKLNDSMSELDKLALNIMYPSGYYKDYKPKLKENCLYYCGRYVMKDHNRPAENMTDGRCGPNNGPNCAACRVFKTKLSEKAINKGVWQGMNGYFYCGKYFGVQEKGHDGFCGAK